MGDEHVRTSETHPIYADFVPEEHTGTLGRLGMTFAPGMKTPGQTRSGSRRFTAEEGPAASPVVGPHNQSHMKASREGLP
jgi:hypothetical protein